jgi:hypothetical protein
VRISSAHSRLGAKLIAAASILLALWGMAQAQSSLDISSDIPKSESSKLTPTLRLLCQTIHRSKVLANNPTEVTCDR